MRLTDLDSNRNAPPHAPVHVARAAAAQQHSQLHLLKLTLLQAGHLAVVGHQILARLGMPDVAGEGIVCRRCVALGPAVTWPHHTCPSRVGPHVSLQATCAGDCHTLCAKPCLTPQQYSQAQVACRGRLWLAVDDAECPRAASCIRQQGASSLGRSAGLSFAICCL